MSYRKVNGYRIEHRRNIKLPYTFPDVAHDFFTIKGRIMTVEKGYYWDGASGPVRDNDSNMEASLAHDVLYQAMRERLLPGEFQTGADRCFYKMCIDNGVWKWRAKLYLSVLKDVGWRSCVPGDMPKIYEFK